VLGKPAASTGKYRFDGPKIDHALTMEPGHSMGARHDGDPEQAKELGAEAMGLDNSLTTIIETTPLDQASVIQ
jgi:hypothetical protein